MPHPNSKPDTFNPTGIWEGHDSTFYTKVDVLFQRVDLLEKTVQNLQQECAELSTHTSFKSSHNVCHQSTQTESPNFKSPMDFDALRSKICDYQNKDKDINVLKYFIQHNIEPEADEINKFEPRTRRYFWQFSRFMIQDGTVYRKKMDSDRVTELLQLVVPTCLIPEVLQTIHPSCGHVSFDNTWDTASKSLFWPYMRRDITNFSKNCSLCQNHSTSSDSSPAHQLPSFTIEKAVCAITELTKDFINITKQQPPMKHRKTRNRKRRQPTTHPKSTIHDHQQLQSPPPKVQQHQTPQFAQQQSRYSSTISPPRDRHRDPYSTTREPHSDLSHRSHRNSPPRSQFYHSPKRDNHLHSPPRFYPSDSSAGNHRSYYSMPPREHHYSPLRGLDYDFYLPGRRDDYFSPPRHTYPPPDDRHSQSELYRFN